MIVKHNKKYAIIPVSHMAVELDKLAPMMEGSIVINKTYESSVHQWQYILMAEQAMQVDIVDGEQIIADSTSHRMLQEKS